VALDFFIEVMQERPITVRGGLPTWARRLVSMIPPSECRRGAEITWQPQFASGACARQLFLSILAALRVGRRIAESTCRPPHDKRRPPLLR